MLKYIVALACLFAIPVYVRAADPTWEFGVNAIPAANVVGDLHIKDKSFFLDGTNVLSLPAGILGDGNAYTIEFEIKTHNRQDVNLIVFAMQDSDYNKGDFRMQVKNGFALGMYGYGAGALYMNNSQTEMGINDNTQPIPQKGEDKYFKLTFVVKNRQVQYFRDGLLLLQTDPHGPIDKTTVLRFGQLRGAQGKPEKLKSTLEVHNLKIYDSIVYPAGYDDTINRRLNYSGPEYSLLRAPITNPKLKRVLIVGDSISMGYRGLIAEKLNDKAYVDYWIGGVWFGPQALNGGTQSKPSIAWHGVANQGPYDVITFNPMTLHWWRRPERCDESYLAQTLQGFLDTIKDSMPNAKVIWVNCTPVRTVHPDGTADLDNHDTQRIRKFNAICQQVIDKGHIPTVDLFSIAEKHMPDVPASHRDTVHWDNACNKQFADAILEKVNELLDTK